MVPPYELTFEDLFLLLLAGHAQGLTQRFKCYPTLAFFLEYWNNDLNIFNL